MRRLHPSRLVLLAAIATAAAADEVPDAVQECAEIDDAGRRLACYDRYAGRDEDAGAAQPAAAPDAPMTPPAAAPSPAAAPERVSTPAPPAAASGEDRFGRPESREEPGEEPDEIAARITEIDVRPHGERVFTLDNGQVWVEDSPTPSLRLEVGDTVRIKSGLFGSHRLFGAGKRSSGVDRVR